MRGEILSFGLAIDEDEKAEKKFHCIWQASNKKGAIRVPSKWHQDGTERTQLETINTFDSDGARCIDGIKDGTVKKRDASAIVSGCFIG